jgi:D-alanyl-lipoteichoic acid acyltransferase DltB (MBOAT superfamily)
MLFNSIEFALFLPVVFGVYWFVFKNKLKAQNFFLFAASSVFYGWWDWRFLFLLYFSASIDFATAYFIDKTESKTRRKNLLLITLVSNLTILGFFKYFNFFADSFALILLQMHMQASVTTLKIVLPVGISFYTFQSIAYVVDVYRKQLKASNNYIEFMAFISFFPQLVAGPIERATHLLKQVQTERRFDYNYAVSGLRLMLYGFFKKVVIADNLSKFVDQVYAQPNDYKGITPIVATLFFAVQIYCDFSGYSDIAIGTARLFGFDLMKNFRTPYFATSLKEFWQRWHISLSTWFRDYLYIPLGGNRVSTSRKYFNLFITFVLSGLWHGANFTFIIWGTIHGLFMVVEDLIKKRFDVTLPKLLRGIITFIIVLYAWVFFRASNLNDAIAISKNMLLQGTLQQLQQVFMQVYYSQVFINILFVGILFFVFCEVAIYTNRYNTAFMQLPKPFRVTFYYILIAFIVFIGLNDSAPNFIYFRF